MTRPIVNRSKPLESVESPLGEWTAFRIVIEADEPRQPIEFGNICIKESDRS